jgi:hypothetical protein
MITVRTGSVATAVGLLLLVTGCSREQQDWRSAETSDTAEGYSQFIRRHPQSELATQARTRVTQLGEDRDWQHAGSADTVDAYREFITQHPNGRWAQEARIRIENFSLGEQAGVDAASRLATAPAGPGAAPAGNADRGASYTGAAGLTSGLAAGAGMAGAPTAGADRGTTGGASIGSGTGAESSLPATGAGAAVRSQSAGIPSGVTRSSRLAAPGEAAVPAGSPVPAESLHSRAPASTSAAGTASSPTVPATGLLRPPISSASTLAPAATASAKPAVSKAAVAGFGVQLGAFSTQAGADSQWRVLASRYAVDLQGLEEHVVPADTTSGRIYRLQATVRNESRARAICDSLRQHGQGCVAVLPH